MGYKPELFSELSTDWSLSTNLCRSVMIEYRNGESAFETHCCGGSNLMPIEWTIQKLEHVRCIFISFHFIPNLFSLYVTKILDCGELEILKRRNWSFITAAFRSIVSGS